MIENKLCVLTVVDSVSATSMPVNEFVLFRQRIGAKCRQVLVVASFSSPNNVVIPKEIEVFMVGLNFGMMRRALCRTKKECKDNDEHLVCHLHGQKSAALFYFASVGLGLRSKTLYTIHSTYSSRNLSYRLSSCLCVLLAKKANCVSHSAFTQYNKIVKRIKGSNFSAIPNGVDVHRVEVALQNVSNRSLNNNSLVCVGRIIPIKNQSYLINLLKLLPKETKLMLIGLQDEGYNMVALAKENGMEDRVCFSGLIPREEVFRRICDSGIYVSASTVEGLPVSVLEAMSIGLIPVLSAIGPHQEIADTCELDITLPLDAKSWAERIIEIQQLDDDVAKKQRSDIVQKIRDLYSLEAMHEQYNVIYEQLAK